MTKGCPPEFEEEFARLAAATDYYILDDGQQVVRTDFRRHNEWLREQGGFPAVAQDALDDLFVSTIFLGQDHRHQRIFPGAPLLFETMVFDKGKSVFQTRSSTWEEATAAHAEGLAHARRLLALPRDRERPNE